MSLISLKHPSGPLNSLQHTANVGETLTVFISSNMAEEISTGTIRFLYQLIISFSLSCHTKETP